MEMQLVSGKALPYPGTCQGCGSATRDCIDLGFDLEDDAFAVEDRIVGRNAALICTECFKQLAKLMDYIPADSAPVNSVVITDDHYEEVLRRARLAANELADLLDSSHNHLRDSYTQPALEFDTSSEDPKASTGQLDSTDGQKFESFGFKGSNDLPSDTGIESDYNELRDLLES